MMSRKKEEVQAALSKKAQDAFAAKMFQPTSTETEPVRCPVPMITSATGGVRKVRQYAEHYSVITDGIQGVRGWQPKLLFYDRTPELDKAFDAGKIKAFAELASKTIGGMR